MRGLVGGWNVIISIIIITKLGEHVRQWWRWRLDPRDNRSGNVAMVVVVVVNVVGGDRNRSVTIAMLRSSGSNNNKRQSWGNRFAKRSAPKSGVGRQDEESVKQRYYRESIRLWCGAISGGEKGREEKRGEMSVCPFKKALQYFELKHVCPVTCFNEIKR